MSIKKVSLPIIKELEIPAKISSRKHFVQFLESLCFRELVSDSNFDKYDKNKMREKYAYLTSDEYPRSSLNKKLKKIQRDVDRTIEYYNKYAALIKESFNLDKDDARYFNFYDLNNFESIYHHIEKVIEINKVKKFATKYLGNFAYQLFDGDGNIELALINNFKIIMDSDFSHKGFKQSLNFI